MHRNLTAPVAGDALSAAWARELVDELRRCRLSVAWPLVVRSRGPAGTVLALSDSAAGAAGAAGTWELTVTGGQATCVNCMVMTTTVTFFAEGDEMELTASMSGTVGWLCGTLNTETKVVGLAFTDPPTALQEDSEVIYYPLYKMACKDGKWGVKIDARNMPRIGAYL